MTKWLQQGKQIIYGLFHPIIKKKSKTGVKAHTSEDMAVQSEAFARGGFAFAFAKDWGLAQVRSFTNVQNSSMKPFPFQSLLPL